LNNYKELLHILAITKENYHKALSYGSSPYGDSEENYLHHKIQDLEYQLEKEKYKYEKEQSMSDYYGVDPNVKSSWYDKKEVYDPWIIKEKLVEEYPMEKPSEPPLYYIKPIFGNPPSSDDYMNKVVTEATQEKPVEMANPFEGDPMFEE
jgi:hypothetical protein